MEVWSVSNSIFTKYVVRVFFLATSVTIVLSGKLLWPLIAKVKMWFWQMDRYEYSLDIYTVIGLISSDLWKLVNTIVRYLISITWHVWFKSFSGSLVSRCLFGLAATSLWRPIFARVSIELTCLRKLNRFLHPRCALFRSYAPCRVA